MSPAAVYSPGWKNTNVLAFPHGPSTPASNQLGGPPWILLYLINVFLVLGIQNWTQYLAVVEAVPIKEG